MVRFLLVWVSILVLSGCATSKDVRISYSGLDFYVPGEIVAIGSAGGEDNFLGLKYSPTPGKRFIAFTKEGIYGTGGCDYPAFFQQVLMESDTNDCEQSAVESFRQVFKVGHESGVWSEGGYDVYFFPGDQKVFVFLVLDDKTVIKIDSDFLDTEGMRAVLADQI